MTVYYEHKFYSIHILYYKNMKLVKRSIKTVTYVCNTVIV